jgi:hypothetical protein
MARRTVEILLAAMAAVPMWPRVKEVCCESPAMMRLLPHVIGPKTSSVQLWFGSAAGEGGVWGVNAPEEATILSTIGHPSGLLDRLSLRNVWRVNDRFCEAFRRLVSKNVRSLTSIALQSTNPVSVPVVQDVFQLPLLRYLTMYIPALPDPFPGIPTSLTGFWVTVDNEKTLAQVLTACWGSRVTLLNIAYEGTFPPVSWKDLAETFPPGQLTQTLTNFSWTAYHPHELDPGMLQAILPFTNLQSLQIKIFCEEGCVFTFSNAEVCELSSALPNLRTLHLGEDPCGRGTTGVSFATLATISKRCKHLQSLRIHFNPMDIIALGVTEAFPVPDDDGEGVRSECALVTLNVGNTKMPGEKGLLSWYMALALLEIFPRLSVIRHRYDSEIWEEVEQQVQRCKAIKRLVRHM